MTANDSGPTNENHRVLPFKEWVTVILSVTKEDALLPGIDDLNWSG